MAKKFHPSREKEILTVVSQTQTEMLLSENETRNFFKKPFKRNMSGDNKPRSKKAKETFQEEGHLQT